MEMNLLEVLGEPPPFAIAALLGAVVVLAARSVRRFCRREGGRVTIGPGH